MLVFRGLGAGGGGHVPLDLADDGEAVDVPVGRGRHGGAEIQDGLGGFLLCIVFRLGGLGESGHSQQPSFRGGSFSGFSEITRAGAESYGIVRYGDEL